MTDGSEIASGLSGGVIWGEELAHSVPESAKTPSDKGLGLLERFVTGSAAGLLTAYGVKRKDWLGGLLAAGSLELWRRAVTGHSYLYATLGLSSTKSVASDVHRIKRSITINRPVAQVFDFCISLRNWPKFIGAVDAEIERPQRLVFRPHRPELRSLGLWELEFQTSQENEWIAFRILEPGDLDAVGLIGFTKAPGRRGTEVAVILQVRNLSWRTSSSLSIITGKNVERAVRTELRRLKQFIEGGEVPTVDKQPSARRGDSMMSPLYRQMQDRAKEGGGNAGALLERG